MSDGKKQHGWRNAIIIAVVILVVIITPLLIYASANIEKKDLDDAARTQQGGTYVKLPDGITHYELTGPETGQVVVLVHGMSVPMYGWDAQVEPLTQAGFRVLRYDMFGRGYSDRPVADYSQAFYRKQLFDLLNTLKIQQPVDLVGHSLGGGVVIDFTADYAERVKDVVLIAPLINSENEPNIKLLRPPLLGEFLMRLVATKSLTDRAAQSMQKSPKAAEYAKLFQEQMQYKGFARAMLAMFRGDAVADHTADYVTVGKQGKKVMLIWGTLDGDIKSQMVKDIRTTLPSVNYQELEAVGHFSQVEVPDKINSLVIDFLK
jgi:pimeloyl-ACP methyl ester carboxylesterase